jgi:uncharacterized protein YdbL (DUF1318 family)
MKLLLAVLLAACVTVNVYFPAAAVQSAADKTITEILNGPAGQAQPQGSTENKPQGSTLAPSLAPVAPAEMNQPSTLYVVLGTVLNALVPPAHAQGSPNIDVSSPEIRAIVSSMAARTPQLKPYFASGAVGYTSNGDVEVRDQNAVPLPERANVKRLVSEDNRDREQLYSEIAKANGHPEWKDDIRRIFAQRWVANASGGTWYQDGGAWKQK